MNILKMNLIVAGFLLAMGAAQAQSPQPQPTPPPPGWICSPDFPQEILEACGNADLLQFESDAVTNFLQLHRLPASASSIIYQYGRADLRNKIRAFMFADLLRIVKEDASLQTAHEQALLNWFNGQVQFLQQLQWQRAVADIQAWENNPCTWKPDPAVAAAYGLTYDAGEWCSGNPNVQAFSPGAPVPSPDYFLAAALKNTFGNAVTNSPFGSATEESVQQESYLTFAYSAIPAVGISSASALGLYQYFLNSPFGYAASSIATERLAAQATIENIARNDGLNIQGSEGPLSSEATAAAEQAQGAAEEAASELASSAATDFAAGPAAIILLAVEIGVEAGFEFVDYNTAVNNLNAIVNNPPTGPGLVTLQTLANDPSGTGTYKLMLAFTSQTLPDNPSTQPLPTHRAGVDPYFVLQTANSPNRTDTETLTYTDLAGTQWSIQTYEGFFLQSGTLASGTAVNTISPTLTITDPQGFSWAVDWIGQAFLLTKIQPADTDTACPADPTSGVSTVANFETCSSYVAFNFQIQNGTLVSLGHGPVFTSDPIAGVPLGQNFSVSIAAAGVPTPAIGPTGFIPPGVSVSGGANGSLTLSGVAGNVQQGTYTIPLQATNGSGRATQNFTLVVGLLPQIVSPAQFNDSGAVTETFTIRAAGNPTPSISLAPGFWVPPGYSFHDNGNGTATLSGATPAGYYLNPQTGQTNLFGGTVVASNVLGQTSQALTINFVPAPTPSVVGLDPGGTLVGTFTAGTNNSLSITTTGATTPVSIRVDTSGGYHLPGWMKLHDNGNGTATVSGNPPLRTAPYDVDFSIFATAAGQLSVYFEPTIAIHVSVAPLFTDTGKDLMTICVAKQPCGLSVHTNMLAGSLSLSRNVPAGLTLNANSGLLQFETATGGVYPVTVTATNSYGSTSQIYTFYVRQNPGFPTANGDQLDIWLMAEVPASFSIPTTAYPHDTGVNTPGGTQILPPMQLSLQTPNGIKQTVPKGLSFTSQTPAGVPTGTGLIGGTPADGAEGQYPLTLDANNGFTAYLNMTLHVRMPGDVNNDGHVDCADVNLIRAALGTFAGQAGYNVQADINNDGAVNVADLALIAKYLPQGCPLH